MEESAFISDEELRSLVTESATELYDRLIGARGQEYYRTTAEVLTVPNRPLYDLPSDFYQLLGVFMAPGQRLVGPLPEEGQEGRFQVIEAVSDAPGGCWTRPAPFMIGELDGLLSNGSSCRETMYRLRGAQTSLLDGPQTRLELRPVPSGVHTLRIEYIPTCTAIKPLSDTPGLPTEPTFDGINGWEEHVVLTASIQILGMEESSTSHLEKALARIEERIDGLASSRDAGRAERVTDTTGEIARVRVDAGFGVPGGRRGPWL